jgi:MYXO-CTERM domain-containing protein
MNKRCTLILIAFVALVGIARVNAQYLTGSITAASYPLSAQIGFDGPGFLQFGGTNIVQSATGNLAGILPINSKVFSVDYLSFSGLSTTPQTVSDQLFYFPVTSYPYRFTFTLDTIAQDSYNSATGAAVFTGTGTIADSTGTYQDTPANLTVDFTSFGVYSFTLDAVPEPTTASLAVAGLFGLWAWRPRRP